MKQLIVGGMIAVGIVFMVVSCFTYSIEHEDKDKALELIEDVGYVAVFTVTIMLFSLMVV
ncbi:hypothetical protein FYM97_08890 [Lactobacillus salivarius]|jgi:hypothetical protein|uniref:hypothetical protein n=1 Tax=Ligilactobacillus salivarius TaxID=1624 RepID=UPI0013684370|nr:hypothetical protein [Ligilactobacillus salivarius]MYY87875.1 hypothetical protein [Ligilactobacillus salivarius]MYZ70819.1 hypothetical protein [Ligilactobacillus salivarius]